jgi:hypothetical protein
MAEDSSDWQYGVDEVGEEATAQPAREPIEPESVDLENALFVVVGVVGTVLVFLFGVL